MRETSDEFRAVDDVAAIAGQRDAALRLGVGGARLGELAGHAADLHHRQGGAEGQHHRHLQQHAEGVADDVGGEIGEAFGAVAALQHEGLALGGERQLRLQAARLAGEHQRRVFAAAGLPCPRASSGPDRSGTWRIGQSRQELGFHGRGDAALAGVVVGMNGLLSAQLCRETAKMATAAGYWLLRFSRKERAERGTAQRGQTIHSD